MWVRKLIHIQVIVGNHEIDQKSEFNKALESILNIFQDLGFLQNQLLHHYHQQTVHWSECQQRKGQNNLNWKSHKRSLKNNQIC